MHTEKWRSLFFHFHAFAFIPLVWWTMEESNTSRLVIWILASNSATFCCIWLWLAILRRSTQTQVSVLVGCLECGCTCSAQLQWTIHKCLFSTRYLLYQLPVNDTDSKSFSNFWQWKIWKSSAYIWVDTLVTNNSGEVAAPFSAYKVWTTLKDGSSKLPWNTINFFFFMFCWLCISVYLS